MQTLLDLIVHNFCRMVALLSIAAPLVLVGYFFRGLFIDLQERYDEVKRRLDVLSNESRTQSARVSNLDSYIDTMETGIQSQIEELREQVGKVENRLPKKPRRPLPSNYGYVEPELGEPGGWTIEGGEEAYMAALKEFELANPTPTTSV